MHSNLIRLCITALALVMFASQVQAQTSESRSRTVKRSSAAPVLPWTGFYGGFNVGYGLAGISDNAPVAITGLMTGAIGGAQIGFNYQSGSLVLGVEADIQASAQEASFTRTLPFVGDFAVGHRIPYFGTARARVGYAFTCGCVMAYLTAGVAYGAYEPFATAFGVTLNAHYTNVALAAGAGVEWMVAERWSTKLEALYLDTGNVGTGLTVPFIGTIYARARSTVTRFGVNYHF